MLKNVLVTALTFSFALLILIVSVFRVAEIKYVLSQSPSPTPSTNPNKIFTLDYKMPYPGKISPDSILWPLKALRDRIWTTLTLNPSKKADLYLLLADKRLVNSKELFQNNKADLGLSVLTKAEKYLEMANTEEIAAQKAGMDTKDFLNRYATATLEHRIIIDEILNIAPEDAKPLIIKNQDYSKKLYQEAKKELTAAGAPVPQSPFNEN